MLAGCIALIADFISSAAIAAWFISPGCLPPQAILASLILLAVSTAVAIHAYFVSDPFSSLVDFLAAMIVAAALACLGIFVGTSLALCIAGCLG